MFRAAIKKKQKSISLLVHSSVVIRWGHCDKPKTSSWTFSPNWAARYLLRHQSKNQNASKWTRSKNDSLSQSRCGKSGGSLKCKSSGQFNVDSVVCKECLATVTFTSWNKDSIRCFPLYFHDIIPTLWIQTHHSHHMDKTWRWRTGKKKKWSRKWENSCR